MKLKVLAAAVLVLGLALVGSWIRPASADRLPLLSLPPSANVTDSDIGLGAGVAPPAAQNPGSPLDLPGEVWVDDDYNSGNCGGHTWGVDCFNLIQDGINGVASGGIVNVAAGTYRENVTVSKTAIVSGAGQANTLVQPFLSNPDCRFGGAGSLCSGGTPGASNVIAVEADNVVIRDLTVDGDNPLLTSGVVRGGADLDARNGIITNHAAGTFNGLEVHHSTIKNIYLRAVYASSGGTFNVHDNAVQNVRGEENSVAIMNWMGAGTIAYNVVTDANDAICANHSTGTSFQYNTVTNSGSGVHSDNNGDSGGTADLLQGNNVSACSSGGYGVWVFAARLNASVDQNTVTGCAVGLAAAGQYGGIPTFTRNSVDAQSLAGSVGAYVTTSLFGWGSADVVASFTNNSIQNSTYGTFFESEAGNSLGSTLADNSLTGNTYGTAYDDSGTIAVNASANWWGSADPAMVAATVSGGPVVDYTPWLASGTDSSGDPGFQGDFSTLWVDDDSPQTGTIGRIQEGIDLVSGSTVNVAPGTYPGNIIVDKSVTLLGDPGDASAGPGPGAPVIDGGSAPGDAFLIDNGVSHVTIQGFEIRNFTSDDTGIGNGVSAWEASTSYITIQDNYFHDLGYNGVLVGNDGAAGDHTDWLIKNNIVANVAYIGFELTNTSNSSIEDNVIHLNTPVIGAIFSSARRSETGLTIKNNLIDGTPSTSFPVIYIYAYDLDMPNPHLDGVLIEGNTISTAGTPYQIYVRNIGTGTITGVEIHDNTLSTLKNLTAAPVDAEHNYWGTVVMSEIAPKISGQVDWSPWCSSDFSVCTYSWPVHNVTQGTDYMTIQAAVNDADPGDVIQADAGTYVEQVTINKSLTLSGDGAATTFIQAPAPMVGDASGSKNVVTVTGSGVAGELSGFTVEGPGSADLSVGIYVRDGASADIHDNVLEDLGTGGTLGILVGRKAHSTTGTATITANAIRGYGKGGIVVDNVGSSATINGNTVTGHGADPVTAQNGIQISRLATATVSGNTVSDHVCTNSTEGCTDDPTTSLTADGASGILLYVSGGGVTISGNTLTGNQYAVWTVAAAEVQVLNNMITGASGTGIAIWDSDQWTDDLGYSPVGTVGMVANNTLSTHQYGLLVRDYDIGGVVPSVTALENSLTGNSVWGAWADVEVDASANWWGSEVPATVKATVNNGSHIDYTPWLASGTDMGDPGYQGDFSTLWVDDDSPQTGTAGRIQEGIDLVSGSTVNVAAGMYRERILINKPLTLRGATYLLDKNGYTVPAGYAWDPAVESIINNPDPDASPSFVVDIVDTDDVTVEGFVVERLNALAGASDNHLFRLNAQTRGLDNIVVRNNVLGPNTNVVSQNGTAGRMGLYLAMPNYSDYDITNSLFAGNKIFDCKGNGNNVFIWGGAASYNPAQRGDLTGTVIEDNEIYGSHRSGIEIAGSADHLTIRNNAIYGNSGLPTDDPNNLKYGNGILVIRMGSDKCNHDGQGAEFLTVEDNEIYGNEKNGIYLGPVNSHHAVTGNDIHDNGWDGIRIDLTEQYHGGTCPVYDRTADIVAHQNTIVDNTGYGAQVAGAPTNGFVMNAELNWWGSACGPGGGDPVSSYVDYSPWWADDHGGSTAFEGPGGELVIPTGTSTAEAQAILDCAAGKTAMFESGSYPGGLFLNGNAITVKLNGCTVNAGSPAFTVVGDDESIVGPGRIDGGGGGGGGIVVNAGADNFILQKAQITGWANGVEVAGSVTSLKIVDNWIHTNTQHGLRVDDVVDLGGVVTVEGNLFKNNTGNGIEHDGNGTLPAEYNSWGDPDGAAAGAGGDGIGGDVDADPYTYVESFFDVWPDTLALERHVPENTTFDVALKADAVKVYGLTFKFTYDTARLTLNSTVFSAPWAGKCTALPGLPGGTVGYWCSLNAPGDPEWTATAGTLATFSFTTLPGTPGNGPWEALFDLSYLELDTGAGAIGGQKVFVNNAGFNAPSAPERDITDANDGKIVVERLANYTGFADLQGRANDSQATIKVYDREEVALATLLAQGTSASSGAYTTAYAAPYWLAANSTYWFQVDRALYLPTTRVYTPPAPLYGHSHVLDVVPLTALGKVVLLGGDATNNDYVDIGDLSCMGANYGGTGVVCGTTGWSDVNGDGLVSIQDLSLGGGNFYKASSPWTP